ncbi:hypothetical protein [Dictyobacter alpinus]|uniref:hypothetical protein n=1 Tax=Dictyobacter alpinus TaxID=2014873 RepID=UPI000F847A0B|nr:hypothetical protein [Dictyobacter alpinus]
MRYRLRAKSRSEWCIDIFEGIDEILYLRFRVRWEALPGNVDGELAQSPRYVGRADQLIGIGIVGNTLSHRLELPFA